MPHLNYLQSIISLGKHNPQLARQPASTYHILPFISGSHQHQAGGNPPGSLQGLPVDEEDEDREVIPSEGEGDSLAHQSLEALFGWSQVLKDSGKSLPLTEDRRQELTASVIYFYLFQHFHLIFFPFTV